MAFMLFTLLICKVLSLVRDCSIKWLVCPALSLGGTLKSGFSWFSCSNMNYQDREYMKLCRMYIA